MSRVAKRWRHKIFNTLLIGSVSVLLLSILLTLPLRWFAPPTTAFILSDPSLKVGTTRTWVTYEEVSQELLLAVISAEDQHFFNHWGIDIASIKKSLGEGRGRPRGASTISQQLAKNLYLWSGRSYFRKAVEAWLTLCLEVFVGKQRILEIYINVVEFGTGIYGAEQASHVFFGKSPAQLNNIEASLLAAVLPSPKNYSVNNPSAYIHQRAREIRRWMPDIKLMYQHQWP